MTINIGIVQIYGGCPNVFLGNTQESSASSEVVLSHTIYFLRNKLSLANAEYVVFKKFSRHFTVNNLLDHYKINFYILL